MAGRECYHCKQRIEEGQEHDCWTTTEAALTHDLPGELRDAWERVRETAVSFGDQRIYASHKSIMFSRQSCLVGSDAGAVTRRLILGSCPGFPPSCPVRICRSPVSNVRHIARSVRIYRTTRSCTVRGKGYEAYQDGAAAEDDCGWETRLWSAKTPSGR